MQIPTFDDVLSAHHMLQGHVRPTPMFSNPIINIMTGRQIWFKPECNQKVSAFKYRGAFNRLSRLTKEEKKRGVVAFSSGNHAQGVARAAREIGLSAKIVMPTDAPAVKIAGVRSNGGEIIFYDRHHENREQIASDISKRVGRVLVPSYDDPYIIAGQGTVGLEIVKEAQDKNIDFEALITPLGGGGLCAGISLAFKALSAHTRIYGAEPEFYDDHAQSLISGRRESLKHTPPTICDAIMTPTPGKITFEINQHTLSGVGTASDRNCMMSLSLLKNCAGVTVEPGGVIALATLLAGSLQTVDANTVCVVLSGGNIDPQRMTTALNQFDFRNS